MPVPISTTARASRTEARNRSAAPPPEPIGTTPTSSARARAEARTSSSATKRLGVGPARGLDRRRGGRDGGLLVRAPAGLDRPAWTSVPTLSRRDRSERREHRVPCGSLCRSAGRAFHRVLSVDISTVRKDRTLFAIRRRTGAAPGGARWRRPTAVPTWDEVVERHSDRVYRLAYRLTGNRHDAEDLTQEVFVRVFRSLSTYTPGTFEGWLHRITTNLFLDQARRKQRIRFDALSDERAARLTQRRAHARTRRTPTRPSTTTSSGPWPPCRRTSGPPSCSATSRGSPTRRSPTSSAPSSAPSAPASTAAAPCCARPWPTGPRGRPGALLRARHRPDPDAAGERRDRAPRLSGQRPARRPALARGGRARLGARPPLPRLPRPGRARGLGQDPPRRALLRRHGRARRTSRARCSAPHGARRSDARRACGRRRRSRDRAGASAAAPSGWPCWASWRSGAAHRRRARVDRRPPVTNHRARATARAAPHPRRSGPAPLMPAPGQPGSPVVGGQ